MFIDREPMEVRKELRCRYWYRRLADSSEVTTNTSQHPTIISITYQLVMSAADIVEGSNDAQQTPPTSMHGPLITDWGQWAGS